MLNGIVEFLGWFGAVTVLAGYILFSTGKLPNGPVYQLLNLVGGLAIAVNVGAHHAIPSLIVNGIWAIVAVVVLTKMLRARQAAERGEPVAATTGPILVEPPTTTAVLPVVGPALRDHDDTTDHDHTTDHGDTTEPDTGSHVHTEAYEEARVHTVGEAPTAPAPMTETVPVITATIALALVAAAQREHQGNERQQQDNERQQQDHERQRQDHERQRQDHVPEQPELA